MKLCLRIVLLLFLVTETVTQDFDLGDALDLDDPTLPPKVPEKVPEKPKANGDAGLDLSDFFDTDPVPEKPKKPAAGGAGGTDLDLLDAVADDGPTKAPKKPSGGDGFGFDLADALGPDPNPQPDKPAVKPGGGGGGSFDDKDLFDVGGGDYKPDKGKSGGSGGRAQDPANNPNGGGADDTPQEAGSGQIAGIASAIGVAILGAASSYFAYQKKKLCFKLQGGVDPESGKGHETQSDPQVMSNLLSTS